MPFWTTEALIDSKDPKRGFRFKIIFEGLVSGPIVWFAKKVTKPNFSLTEAKHSFLNHSFYYPARVEWQEISMTLVDPVSPIDAVAQTNRLIEASGYQIPKTENDLETMSKGKARTAIDPIQIIQLDANGNSIEVWKLKNPFIKSVKYGELSYEDDNLTEIEIGLRYDWAVCETNNGESGPQTFFDTSA
jgi:hypothetical protein